MQKAKKSDYQASLGSSEAKRRLLHKNKKKNQLMKKNIGMLSIIRELLSIRGINIFYR